MPNQQSDLPKYEPRKLSKAELGKRKRFLGATVITCIAAAMVFGVSHVVKLGANRMADMRDRVTYNIEDEKSHIRAAGEEILIHETHEKNEVASLSSSVLQIESMLPAAKWGEINRLVLIPKGEFFMGTDLPASDEHDRPMHKVMLDDFYIDMYPVTTIQFAKFLADTGHRPPLDWKKGEIPEKKLLHPVTMVTWYDARDYCSWAGKRLLTEAEWEKAARGYDNRRWPWGNNMDPTKLNTYYYVGSTTSVMTYETGASSYGVYDLAGNVSEWTSSDFVPYDDSPASTEVFQAKKVEASSPKDQAMKVAGLVPTDGVYKVRRGGSWKSDPFSTSTYHRNFSFAFYASDFFGFRCGKDRQVNN